MMTTMNEIKKHTAHTQTERLYTAILANRQVQIQKRAYKQQERRTTKKPY